MAIIDPKTGLAAAQAVRTAAPVSVTPGALVPAPAPAAPVDPKIAQLAAGAQGGSAGLTAFKQAQQTIDELQANALANARQRASIIGGPEAQGFEAIAGQQYDRNRANLATSNAAFEGLQGKNKAAFDKYFGQLKGDMGAINDYIKTTLGGYEAKKRASAEKAAASKFPLDEILGETEYGLPAATKAAEDAKGILGQAATKRDQLKNGDYLFTFGEQAKGIRDKLAIDTREYYKSGTSDERKKFLAGKMEQNKARLAKVEGLSKSAQASREKDLAAAESEVAKLQADYDKKAALVSSPEQFARNIAVTKYGQDPYKAAGKLTADKFYPKQATQADVMKYGEEAVGLSQKLNINGGARRVAEILSDTEVVEDLDTLSAWAQTGEYTLSDVKKEMGRQYLNTKKPEDRDKYNVLIEMTARLPWKSDR